MAALDNSDPTSAELLRLYQALAESFVLLESDGPDRFRDELSDITAVARPVAEIDSEVLDGLADPDAVEALPFVILGATDDELLETLAPELRQGARDLAVFDEQLLLIAFDDAGTDDGADDLGSFLEAECGDVVPIDDAMTADGGTVRPNTDRIPGTGEDPDDAVVVSEPPEPVLTEPAEGEVFSETPDGPFGGATISNVDMQIASAEWSNLTPDLFGGSDVAISPQDEDRRWLYLTIDLANQDPNDAVPTSASRFFLVDPSGECPAQEVGDPSIAANDDGLEPATSQTRTFGFDVGEVVDLSAVTVEYRFLALPGAFDVLASESGGESPDAVYPIALERPAPLEYIGNLAVSCDVVYTWTVDDASVSIDLPAPLALENPFDALRSHPGTRWLRLTGAITTGAGTGSCTSPQGAVANQLIGLVVDGRSIEPAGAPIATLFENDTVALDLYWSIPVDAESIGIRADGRDGPSEVSPIAVPDLPLVAGD